VEGVGEWGGRGLTFGMFAPAEKWNRHRFQTLPACDLINFNLYNRQYLCRKCLKAVTILFLLAGRAFYAAWRQKYKTSEARRERN